MTPSHSQPESTATSGGEGAPGFDAAWFEDLVSKVRMIARNASGTTSLNGNLISFEHLLMIAANQIERLPHFIAIADEALGADPKAGA